MAKRILLAKGVDYYPETGNVHLIRCPKCNRENYAPAVADGVCVWCGFNGKELLNDKGTMKNLR
jgi:ribosomal protein L37E